MFTLYLGKKKKESIMNAWILLFRGLTKIGMSCGEFGLWVMTEADAVITTPEEFRLESWIPSMIGKRVSAKMRWPVVFILWHRVSLVGIDSGSTHSTQSENCSSRHEMKKKKKKGGGKITHSFIIEPKVMRKISFNTCVREKKKKVIYYTKRDRDYKVNFSVERSIEKDEYE